MGNAKLALQVPLWHELVSEGQTQLAVQGLLMAHSGCRGRVDRECFSVLTIGSAQGDVMQLGIMNIVRRLMNAQHWVLHPRRTRPPSRAATTQKTQQQ